MKISIYSIQYAFSGYWLHHNATYTQLIYMVLGAHVSPVKTTQHELISYHNMVTTGASLSQNVRYIIQGRIFCSSTLNSPTLTQSCYLTTNRKGTSAAGCSAAGCSAILELAMEKNRLTTESAQVGWSGRRRHHRSCRPQQQPHVTVGLTCIMTLARLGDGWSIGLAWWGFHMSHPFREVVYDSP